jgi:hypothetical protein
VIARLCISDETSSSILYTLQRSNSRLREACQCSVAIVESAEYKCSDQTLGDFFASRTTDLTQSPQLEEAAADNSIYVLLHCQLSIKVNTKIPYDRNRLDDVITN